LVLKTGRIGLNTISLVVLFSVLTLVLLGSSSVVDALTLEPGDIIVVDVGADAIIKVDPVDGTQSIILMDAPNLNPGDIAIDANGNLIFSDGGIFKFDVSTCVVSQISDPNLVWAPDDIAIEGDGNIIVGDPLQDAIFRLNPNTGNITPIGNVGDFPNPFGLAIDGNGDIIGVSAGFELVFKVDPSDGSQSTVHSGSPLNDPSDVAIDNNGDFIVPDLNGAAIHKVSPGGGATAISSSGIKSRGATIDLNGDILYSDFSENQIVKLGSGVISSGGFFTNILADLVVYPSSASCTPPPSIVTVITSFSCHFITIISC